MLGCSLSAPFDTLCARDSILRAKGCWFDEPVVEVCIRSERYDQEITLLHLEDAGPKWQADEAVEDAYDRLSR